VDRLFVTAWPDASARDALEALPRPDEPGVRWVPPRNWHVTLRFLGNCDAAEVAARLAAARFERVVATLGPAVRWLGPQLVVPVTGIDDLARAVADATADLGEPPGHRFRGHLTLARTRRGATSSLVGHRVSTRFTVDEIALVRSELTPDGAVYTDVARSPTT
jgi:2'-5' RNA ligase